MRVFAAAFVLLGLATAVAARAQERPEQGTRQALEQSQSKEKIPPDQLPDAVKAAILGDAYKDWQLGNVYKLKPAEAGEPILYEVEFLNDKQETVRVRFDETGKEAAG